MPDYTVQPEDPPDQRSLNRKLLLVGIITVAFVILIILLFFQLFLQTKSSDVPSVEINKASPSATQATPSAQKDETADWNVFTNTNLRFSFKYPNSFYRGDDFGELNYYQLRFSTCEFEKEGDAEVEQPANCPKVNLEMSLGEITDQYNLVEGLSIGGSKTETSETGDIIYTRQKNFATQVGEWIRYDVQRGGKLVPKYSHEIAIKKQNNVYTFSVSSNLKNVVDDNEEILGKIISTFKFLD